MYEENCKEDFSLSCCGLVSFFSCAIAFFALFLSLSIFNEVWDYEADQNRLQYMSSYTATLTKTEDLDLPLLVREAKGNVLLSDSPILLTISKGEISTMAQIFLKAEEYIYPLVEGAYPNLEEEMQPVCVVGREVAVLSDKGLGDFITIDGTAYKICGIMGTEQSDYLDGTILLWYQKLSETTLEHVKMFQSVELMFESNKTDTYESYRKIYEPAQENENVLSLIGTGSYTDDHFGKNNTEAYFYLLLYAFALLHCIVASEIWAYERRYELSIKKMIGFSVPRLLRDMFRQIFSLTALAAAACFLVQWSLVWAGEALLGIRLRLSLKNLVLVIAFIVFTSVISLLRPIRMLDKEEAVVSMRKRSDGI